MRSKLTRRPASLPASVAAPMPPAVRRARQIGHAVGGVGTAVGLGLWLRMLADPLHPVAWPVGLVGVAGWGVLWGWAVRQDGWLTWQGRWQLSLWAWVLVGGSLALLVGAAVLPMEIRAIARLPYPTWVSLLMPRTSFWYTPVGFGRQTWVYASLLWGALGSVWAHSGYGPTRWWAHGRRPSVAARPIPPGHDLVVAFEYETQHPVVIPGPDRPMHMTVVGPTGGGKSVLLHSLAQQDLARADIGLIVIEPKGDLLKEPVGPDQTPGVWPLALAYAAAREDAGLPRPPMWLVDPARAGSAVLNPLAGDPTTAAEGIAWLYVILEQASGKSEGFFRNVNRQYLTQLVALVHLLEPDVPRWATFAALLRDEGLLFQGLLAAARLYGLDRPDPTRPTSRPAFVPPQWKQPEDRKAPKEPARPPADPLAAAAHLKGVTQPDAATVANLEAAQQDAVMGGRIERAGRLTDDFVHRQGLPTYLEACFQYWLKEYWVPASKMREWAMGARAVLAPFFNHPALVRILDAAPGRDVVDLDAVLDGPGVLCISLAQGTLGPALASAFGVLITTQLDGAVKRRKDRQEQAVAAGQPHRLPFVHAILDEFGSYVAHNFGDVLAQARSYNVQFTLAYQAQSQIAGLWGLNFVNSMSTNTRHKIVYGGLSADDVKFWQAQFGFTEVWEAKQTTTRHHRGATWEPEAVNVASQGGWQETAVIDFNALRYLPASEVIYQLTVHRSLQPPGRGVVHPVRWTDLAGVTASAGPMAPDVLPALAHRIQPDLAERDRLFRHMGLRADADQETPLAPDRPDPAAPYLPGIAVDPAMPRGAPDDPDPPTGPAASLIPPPQAPDGGRTAPQRFVFRDLPDAAHDKESD